MGLMLNTVRKDRYGWLWPFSKMESNIPRRERGRFVTLRYSARRLERGGDGYPVLLTGDEKQDSHQLDVGYSYK